MGNLETRSSDGGVVSAYWRVLSGYSMVWVLLGLCLFFSLMTIRRQQPTPRDAANLLWGKDVPTAWGTVVVGSESPADRDFAVEFADRWKGRGVSDPWERIWLGTPQEVRKRIQGDTSPELELILAPGASRWVLFDGLEEKFPGKRLKLTLVDGSSWPIFLNPQNLVNIIDRIVEIAVLAVGMTLVILTGGIDLAVGSLFALSAVVTATLIRDVAGGVDATTSGMVLGALLGITLAGLCGLLNGVQIVAFGVPPFIATLGMMMIARGLAFIISQGQSIDQVPAGFVWLGKGTWMGLPVAVWLMFGIVAIVHWVTRYTTFGRSIYAIGGNEVAARLCGVRVSRVLILTYATSGLLAGLGGVIMASRLGSAEAKYGTTYELDAIAAVVVGGTSLRGGYGTIVGTLIGALIIAVIENGMNLMQIDSYAQKVVFGVMILGAVMIDRYRHKG